MKISFHQFFQIIVLSCFTLIGVSFWQQKSQALPTLQENTVFFINTSPENNGRLSFLDQNNNVISISDDDILIDQFLLWQQENNKKIFFLGHKKQRNTNTNPVKSLYEIDIKTGKQKRIVHDPEAVIEKIWFHPQQRLLILEKRKRNDYERFITLYNVFNKQESPLPIPKPWINFSFAPNNTHIIGLNTNKNVGYEIENFWKPSPKETVLGEYLENFGFSPNGENILFTQSPDKDIFSFVNELVLVQQSGDKKVLLRDSKITKALWISDTEILATSYNKDFQHTLHQINIQTNTTTPLLTTQKNNIHHIEVFNNQILLTIESKQNNNFTIEWLDLLSKKRTPITQGFAGKIFHQ